MKHIVFLTYSMQNGGTERVVSALANDFTTRGDKVTIVLLDEEKTPGYALDERIKLIYLSLGRLSKNKLQSVANMLREIKAFRRCFRDIKPDVVVAFKCKYAVMAKIASLKTRVIGSERSNPNRPSHKVSPWLRRLTVFTDGYIFQTQGARALYPKRTAAKSVVIPNGVFLNIPKEIPTYESRRKVIVSTGRLIKHKRYDLIVEAFAELNKRVPEYQLHIFGKGKEEKSIVSKIKETGVEDSAFLMGVTSDIAGELLSDRIFILASDYEGMPNGLIEAMACGCACVSTDCDFGPSELIVDGENGSLVQKGSKERLAEA
ncbi:MAG: glycosyltransferase, partial [Clostridia bacterium]|nr:glycosyltransferase [Clostridia bacterium]